MLKSRRPDRNRERGQTLVIALAFVALFGLVIAAVLRLGAATALQHVHTESTASSDSLVEGGAAFAAADANRTDLPQIDCVGNGNTTGSLTMAGNGDTVQYSVGNCNPGQSTTSAGGGLPGTPCVLCVLFDAPDPPGKQSSALTDNQTLTVHGDIDINGGVSGGGSITSTGNPPYFPPAFNLLSPYACDTNPVTTCAPLPQAYPNPITDPLAGRYTQPVTGIPTSGPCSQSSPCSVNSGGTLTPGWYSSITGNADYVFSPGPYILTGTLKLSGKTAHASGTDVTIFLACSPSDCSKGGGSLTFSGTGNKGDSFSAPTTGAYAGYPVIYSDPNLTGVLLDAGGNANASDLFTGNVDLPDGDVSIGGGGTGNGVTINGRLVADTVTSKTNASVGSGLTLSGSLSQTSSCTVFDDTVTGRIPPAAAVSGRALVQYRCPNNGLVDFNYVP